MEQTECESSSGESGQVVVEGSIEIGVVWTGVRIKRSMPATSILEIEQGDPGDLVVTVAADIVNGVAVGNLEEKLGPVSHQAFKVGDRRFDIGDVLEHVVAEYEIEPS